MAEREQALLQSPSSCPVSDVSEELEVGQGWGGEDKEQQAGSGTSRLDRQTGMDGKTALKQRHIDGAGTGESVWWF